MSHIPPHANWTSGLNGFSSILFFGPEFSGHPCSVTLREQCNIRMLCFVKKVPKRIKDVDRLWRLWRTSGLRIIFLESLAKNYQTSTNVLGMPGSDNWNMRWQPILETITYGITGIRNPLPPHNVGNEQWQLHHDKQHWIGGEGGELINCLDRYWKSGQACQDFCRGLYFGGNCYTAKLAIL